MKDGGAYERLVRPLLFSLDPETAHHLTLRILRIAARLPVALRALHRFQPPAKPKTLFGLTFPNPIGLAAGFDKNGVALPAWAALGFGFIEIGTVTAKAQPGNPRPRIFRYPEQEALINRLGFNNDGAEVVAARLRKLRGSGSWPPIPVGINIGKSKVTPLDQAVDDYLHSFRLLSPTVDYVVINVSSPNTVGLRSLQHRSALRELLSSIMNENQTCVHPRPILLKIAPDLGERELDEIIATSEEHGLAGIIATNTIAGALNTAREGQQNGGISGAPLQSRSTEIVRLIRRRSQLCIIGVGGICDAESAREKMSAGAQLLQVYTGYIYKGPMLLREITEALWR